MLSWLVMKTAAAAIFAGNPGALSLVVTADEGVVLETLLQVTSLEATPCQDSLPSVVVPWNAELNAWDSVDVPMPAGDFCAVTFRWAPPGAMWIELNETGEEVKQTVRAPKTTVHLNETGGSAILSENNGLTSWLDLSIQEAP